LYQKIARLSESKREQVIQYVDELLQTQ